MSNLLFSQVIITVLIVSSYNIMGLKRQIAQLQWPVKFLDTDSSLKTEHVRSQVFRDLKANNPFHKEINVKKPRSLSNSHSISFIVTDNPNNEQKLMAQAFIKSSNSLCKSEAEIIVESIELEDVIEHLRSKPRLLEIPIENEVIKTDSPTKHQQGCSRSKRFLPYNKVATTRTLDHVRDGQETGMCDHGRLRNRICLPKDRVLRSGRSDLMRRFYSTNNRPLQLKCDHPLDIRGLYRRKRLLRNRKIRPQKNSFKRSNLEDDLTETAGKLLGLSDPSEKELIKSPSYFNVTEIDRSKIKWISKRQETPDEYCKPLRRNRCRKKLTTISRKSINEGKTGKIEFPSTHRCLVAVTCPCSVGYQKCPPQTTCQTESSTCYSSTPGRCRKIDRVTPTDLPEDMCPTEMTTQLVRPRRRKRCYCDCGCGCPAISRRTHPERALAKASCGCGCGCGCSHVGQDTRRPSA